MNWLIFINSFITISALESRVYNGNKLRPTVHGYLVKLEIDYKYRCSGSIISANWILTSAHCFFEDVKLVSVRQNTGTGGDKLLATSDIIIKHPDFIDDDEIKKRQNDIALLKTKKPICIDDNVRAIELSRIAPRVGQSAIIAGYGNNELKKFLPREGVVQISQCPYDVEHLLCSFDKVRAGDSDSGGALTSQGKLAGVTSASCSNAHRMDVKKCITIYANVVPHLDWILSVIGKTQ